MGWASSSNLVVFSMDAFSLDFAGVIVAGFFIDPPTIGSIFSIGITQLITLTRTGQKNYGQQNYAQGRCDELFFGN